MMIYTSEEIAEILRKHALWLAREGGGERADFIVAEIEPIPIQEVSG